MSFTDDLVVLTNTYSLVSRYVSPDGRSGRSIRKLATRPLATPHALTIAWEINKAGTLVQRMMQFEQTEYGPDGIAVGTCKHLYKVSRHPLIHTAAHIENGRLVMDALDSEANSIKQDNFEL